MNSPGLQVGERGRLSPLLVSRLPPSRRQAGGERVLRVLVPGLKAGAIHHT
jgi:hypothetical protein